MTTTKMMTFALALSFGTQVYSQTCSSSSGIDLSKNGGPFASLPARDQGQLGTCYAHSASDLLSSYLKTLRINIYQTAVANDTSMDGGSPGDVIDSFAALGWACTNTSLYRNLFPNVTTNIIGELQETFIGTPIFYTINANDEAGIARQKRIAEKAAWLASNQVASGVIFQHEEALKKYHSLNKEIQSRRDQIKKLEAQKSWFSSNTEINNKISKINGEINYLMKKASEQHAIYVSGLEKLYRKNNLDSLSEEDAAEVVYYNINHQHLKFVSIMKKYGVGSLAPTLAEFIVDRVHHAGKDAYRYAGIMYPYKVIKKVMEKSCPVNQKIKIPSSIKGSSLTKRQHGAQKIQDKIESLLERNRQAISVSFLSSLLTGRDGEHHAVNIIGCRTNGRNTEYLLQNSWGQGCHQYKTSLQSKCGQGRIWVPANDLLNSATEINWISRK